MNTVAKALTVIAFAALFFDYAVAMQPPETGGTRRMLQVYAKTLPTGGVAGFKALPEVRFVDLDRA